MPNTVQLKRSSTANSVPSAGNLVAGELAINYTDGNLFYKNASNVVTVIASNKFSSVTGNVDAGNIRTTGLISATGNITGGNVIAGAGSGGSITGAVLISASGNIIGGALLTAGITSATGNIQGGNVLTGGLISATGNIQGGNVLTGGLISATGNITGGNGIFTTIVNVASHTGAVVSVTGNITGGNLRTGGLISATGAITGAAITGSSLTVSTGNVTAGNLILSGAIIDSTQLDIQTSAANANIVFTPNGTGIVGVSTALSVTGNITGGNLLTGGLISAAGNIIGGNISVADSSFVVSGRIRITSSATGGLINQVDNSALFLGANGFYPLSISAGTSNTTGNISIGSNLSVTGNITGGNLILSGAITDSGQLDIQTSAANSNIVFTPNGTGNVNTGANLSVTGNVTANNATFTNVIIPSTGTGTTKGIVFPANPGGGSSDQAKIQYYAVTGENTRLEFTVTNDAGPSINQDDIYFTANGCVVANNSSESSSSTNAPFLVTGGAGIAKTLYVGGNSITSGFVSATGNVTGGNLLTDGNINSTGSGTQSLTVTSTATAAYVQTTGNNTVNARLQSNASTASVGTISNHLFIIQTNATNAVTIDTSQNVGIGLTPSSIQTGYKAIQIGATVGGGVVSAGTDTYFTNNFYVTGGTWYTGSTGYGSYYNQSAGAHNWSISTTAGAAGAKSLSTQMTLDAGANLSVVGDVIGYASSDKKFKTNIRPIPNALSAVEHIGGKLFDWTDEYMESVGNADGYFRQKEDFGIVAQDVQKVFPLAVRTRPDGSLAVDYVKLSALAFASIAELSAKLKDLEGKINDLTSRT